jgi:hypothetical protein
MPPARHQTQTSPVQQFPNPRFVIAVYLLLSMLFVVGVLSIGEGGPLINRMIAVIYTLINSGWVPAIYLLGALGIGKLVLKAVKKHLQTAPSSPSSSTPPTTPPPTLWVMELGAGFTIMLTLSHLMGVAGILNPLTAWLVALMGCCIVFYDYRSIVTNELPSLQKRDGLRISVPNIVFVLGALLVLLISCNPPGPMWASEFGTYDSLSYHLQLPREWIELGAIRPLEHNVYSFLPSYFESAYLHLSHLSFAPTHTPDGVTGLVANEARALMSIHLFSSYLVILSAIALQSVVHRTISLYLPSQSASASQIGSWSKALLITTPWILVVGTIAYNEIGVVLLGICAGAFVIEKAMPPTLRASLVGLVVAGACCCKPTALFLLAPTLATAFLVTIPPKQASQSVIHHTLLSWIKPIIVGSIVAFITLSPWLIRNHLATGNIVFPQLSSLFSEAHWTTQQHEIYASAHQFDGSLIDRALMLVRPDPNSSHPLMRHRGFSNIQWGLAPWLALISCIVLLAQRSSRRVGLVCTSAIGLPILAWMMLTHLQSRFLIPILPIMIASICLAISTVGTSSWTTTLRRLCIQLTSIIGFAWSVFIVGSQLSSNPFMFLVMGPTLNTTTYDSDLNPWTAQLTDLLKVDETVYLLGDATPLYVRSPVIYNTVYDRWPITQAIEAHPSDPTMWTDTLRQLGIDAVLINPNEIDRFDRSGWLPDAISNENLREWIISLGQPIYQWSDPSSNRPTRILYRLDENEAGVDDQE